MTPLLEVQDLSVSFGGTHALRGLDLSVERGSLHGIIGPNGAGKTTALNALTRFLRADSGTILFDGDPLPKAPHLVARAGVSRTFQTPATFPELTALANVMTGGHRWTDSGLFRCIARTRQQRREEGQLREDAERLLDRVGFDFPIDSRVGLLPYGAHRKVEIARSLMLRPRLLLLDEPTAGLTADEVLAIGALLRDVQQEANGELSILLIEHNVPFIFGLCDRVTAMDKGRCIATGPPHEVRGVKEVIDSYLGASDLAGEELAAIRPSAVTAPVRVMSAESDDARVPESTARVADGGGGGLNVRSLAVAFGHARVLHGVDLHVQPGELVLLYGRNGAGKSTLLNAIMGEPRATSGTIEWEGRPLQGSSVSRSVRRGIVLIPQERGVISGQTVEDNLRLATFGLRISTAEFRRRVEEVMERFPELAARREQLAGTLSGGERQMLAIAKVIIRRPRMLLLDEPSIGLAPPAVAQLKEIVAGINADGVSVLVAEQNVWWVADLAQRAYLLDSGYIVAEGLPADIVTREAVTEKYLGEHVPHPASQPQQEAME